MRQFVLAGNANYGGASVDSVAAGAIACFYHKDGVDTLVDSGTENFGRFNLVLGRGLENGGPVVLPAFRYHMSYSRSDYEAATSFTADYTIPTERLYPFSNYTVIIVKNGIQFNERNKWTATVATGLNPDATKIAAALAKHLNNNFIGHGLKVEANGAKLSFTCPEAGKDYTIILADALIGDEVNMKHATAALNDAAYIQDLWEKAWAGVGYNYTYRGYVGLMYPKRYLKNDLSIDPENKGFTVFTIRFAEPREMKTRDEVVHQIIQVAFPTGAAGIDKFEEVLKGMTDEGGFSGTNLC